MLLGSSSVLHLFVRENLNPLSQLFFACPDKLSGPPVDTASTCILSDGQVYAKKVYLNILVLPIRVPRISDHANVQALP